MVHWRPSFKIKTLDDQLAEGREHKVSRERQDRVVQVSKMRANRGTKGIALITGLLVLLLLSTSVNQSFGNVAEQYEPQGLYKDSRYVISLNYNTLRPYIYSQPHATLVEVSRSTSSSATLTR